MQGYNAQAVCNEHQIVVAAELNADSPDFGHLDPMILAAERELAGAGVAKAPAVVVADAGYWHYDQMDALAASTARSERIRAFPHPLGRAGQGRLATRRPERGSSSRFRSSRRAPRYATMA